MEEITLMGTGTPHHYDDHHEQPTKKKRPKATKKGPLLTNNSYVPALALACTVALSTSLTSINRHQITSTKEDLPILNSCFCIEAALMYTMYMFVSRVLAFALSCIEHRHHRGRSDYYDPNDNEYLVVSLQDEEDLEAEEHGKEEEPSGHNVSLLYYHAQGIHREALISSMYLGGSGCFLALPALGFWDLSITSVFLLSLTLIAFITEHTKHPEFKPNQDKAQTLLTLKRFRWALYATVFLIQSGIFLKSAPLAAAVAALSINTSVIPTPAAGASSSLPVMLLLAFASPLLLRLALPSSLAASSSHNTLTMIMVKEKKKQKRTRSDPAATSLMSPTQALEAALPVSCLHAVLVLGWYTPDVSPARFLQQKALPQFLPMLIICPFCQAAILAFILRAFKNKQSLPLIIILTITAFIVQLIFSPARNNIHLQDQQELLDWILLGLSVKLLILCASFLFYRHNAFLQQPTQHHEQSVLLKEDDSHYRSQIDLADEL